MDISKYIDTDVIANFNQSLPGNVHENHQRVIMGQETKYLRNAGLRESSDPIQLLSALSRFTDVMKSSSPLQREKRHGSIDTESADQAKTRSISTKRALDTFLREAKDAISSLMNSFARIASRIPKKEPTTVAA